MCVCDWEANGEWQHVTDSWRRARKDRRCDECRATIRKGELYHRAVGKWEGELVVNETCARCERINEAHWSAIRELRVAARARGEYSFYDSGYVIGELRCAVACLVKEEPVYLAAFRKAWHEPKAAA